MAYIYGGGLLALHGTNSTQDIVCYLLSTGCTWRSLLLVRRRLLQLLAPPLAELAFQLSTISQLHLLSNLTLMDSGACADLCDKREDSWEKQDESICIMEVNNDVPPKAKLPEAPDCLVPITPEAVRENGDFPIDFQSPLTVIRKQLKLACIDSECNANGSNIAFVDNYNENGSPRTPKDGVFDPFAPGPDNLARAPPSKKYLDELRISVARRLNFDPSFDAIQHQNLFQDAESLSDEDMFESVYESLLQVIVSKQTEGILAQMSNVEYDSDYCKTPASPLGLTGISDTCPGAPVKVKPGGKPRNIQVGLCKKLEF